MSTHLTLPPLAFWCLIRQCEGRTPPAMPRPRYRQDPPGLELMQQGHLELLPLGPLFEGNQEEAKPDEGDG